MALQQDHQAAGLQAREAHVEKTGQAKLGRARARDPHPGDLPRKALLQAVAKARQAAGLIGARGLRDLEGAGHPDDARDILGAGADAALLAAAQDERPQGHAVCRPQGSHLLGAVGLGGREGEKVAAQGANVHGKGPQRLRGVDVEPNGALVRGGEATGALGSDGSGDLADGLDAAHLAVGQLDRDELGLRRDGGGHGARVHAAVGAHAHQGVRPGGQAGQDAVVLGGVGHHMARGGGEGQVVGLGGAGREGDVCRAGADGGCHAGTGVLHGRAGPSRQRIGRRRVVEILGKVGQHLLQDGRVDRGGRGEVQVGLADRGAGGRRSRRGRRTLLGRRARHRVLLVNEIAHCSPSPDSMTRFWNRPEMNSSE